jgi:hypothetical protein
MTDAEIMKALEYCKNQGFVSKCCECRYKNSSGCVEHLITDALDLINRKNAEINKLTYQVNRLKKYDEERDIRLHARLTATAKAEEIKEFAEKLKSKLFIADDNFNPVVTEAEIDNLVKEMVGDTE